jgi:hypothetical protein
MLTALRLADPALSRFEPMKRIICFDDFDRGLKNRRAVLDDAWDAPSLAHEQ